MSSEFTEINAADPCPCGSGEEYGECCVEKNYRFGHDADGNAVRQVQLVDEVVPLLEQAQNDFRLLYGREGKPTERVLSFQTNLPNNLLSSLVRDFRKSGVDESYIYAFYRTEGLLPTKDNFDFISDVDLQTFNDFRTEYEQLVDDSGDDEAVSAAWFVVNGNAVVSEAARTATTRTQMVLNDFISRHGADNAFVEFELKTPVDYCLFSAFKIIKTLGSIEKLAEYGMPESIYALSRGMFENYLFLNAMAEDRDFFATRILPKVDREHYAFEVKNGKINYNRVVHHSSGEERNVWVSPKTLLRYTAKQTDHELYELFYQTASQFVHVDVLSARAYFHAADPYDELDQAYQAHLVAAVLAGMALSALGRIDAVDDGFAADVTYFLGSLQEILELPLQLMNADSEHLIAVYTTFLSVTQEWSTS